MDQRRLWYICMQNCVPETGLMSWHTTPRDDAWREVHLVYLKGMGQRLWLRCNACGHDVVVELNVFSDNVHSESHLLAGDAPLDGQRF